MLNIIMCLLIILHLLSRQLMSLPKTFVYDDNNSNYTTNRKRIKLIQDQDQEESNCYNIDILEKREFNHCWECNSYVRIKTSCDYACRMDGCDCGAVCSSNDCYKIFCCNCYDLKECRIEFPEKCPIQCSQCRINSIFNHVLFNLEHYCQHSAKQISQLISFFSVSSTNYCKCM